MSEPYGSEYQKQYGGPEWFERTLVEVRRRKVLETAARHPSARVLEVGCGMESLVGVWPHPAVFTIVEPEPAFCERARTAASPGHDVTVVSGRLEDVVDAVAARAPFELIVASSLLHEVPDPRRLLSTLRQLADHQTVLHLSVPNVRSFHRLLALEMGQIQDLFEPSEMERRFGRTTRFDRVTLAGMVGEAGFSIRHFETYFVKPFTHRQMEAIVDGGIVDRAVLGALERMIRYMPDLGCEMFVELVRA
jgi:2-polyprenyl-3-methyl-5-hydroxy-6-metoxy-1,4-benzoquinol methylase